MRAAAQRRGEPVPDYLLEGGMVNLWFAGPGGPHPSVAKVAHERKASSLLLMSAVSLGEIEYGHALSSGGGGGGATRHAFVEFLRALPAPIEVTRFTAEIYG